MDSMIRTKTRFGSDRDITF